MQKLDEAMKRGTKYVHNLTKWIIEGEAGGLKDVVTYSSTLAERWFGKKATKEQENEIISMIDELRNIGLYIDSDSGKQIYKGIFCACPDHITKSDGTEIITLAINASLMEKLMSIFIFLLFIDDDEEARNVRDTVAKAVSENLNFNGVIKRMVNNRKI